MNKMIKLMVIAGTILLTAGHAHADIRKNVTIRPKAPVASAIWTNLPPLETAHLHVEVKLKEHGYRIKSGPDVEFQGSTVFWTGGINKKTGIGDFYVVNESAYERSPGVDVSCVWEPYGGGGGGYGPRPKDIDGHAYGVAHLKPPRAEWTIDSSLQEADGQSTINWTVRLLNDFGDPVDMAISYNISTWQSWNIEPTQSPNPPTSSSLSGTVKASSWSRGHLRTQYSYFGRNFYEDSPDLTFVEIEKMQYSINGAWADIPPVIYLSAGSNINFKTLPLPSDSAWPANRPTWTGAYAGTDGTASNTFTQPGTNYVTAKCGNTVTAAVVVVKVDLKKLEFTSDHNAICDGTTVSTAGSRFPNVEWDTTAATPVNAPITHTAGAAEVDKIALTLTLDVSGIPANTPYTITGASAEDALDFLKAGTFSTGSDVTISVTAANAIGEDIRKIEDSITWTIELLGVTVKLGDTGDHVIYTTLGTPDTSAPSGASVPNVSRMDLAVPIVASAITAAGGSGNHTKTVWEIVKAEGSYNLSVVLNDANAWTLPSLPNGADCLSISKFVRNVGMAMGIPGSFDAETYAAYYRTVAEMDRPKTAIAGLSLQAPLVFPGDQGAVVTAGLDPTWELALADQNCTGGPGAPGTVGCWNGINNFEASVIYTDTANKKWYFPGGTDLIYDDIDDIVQIFQTMVWGDFEDHDSDPLTPEEWVVKAVEYTYTLQPNATP